MNDSTLASDTTNVQDSPESECNFNSVKRIPFYFGAKDKPLLGWLHTTDSKQHLNTGVIVCPPLAVEYMNSYRSLRYVADYFALAGIPALRFDYHGTGDSSGIEEDENRIEDWLNSIEQACTQLKTMTGCSKVGLFGLRMGATLASVFAESNPIDFLTVWAPLYSGRSYVREIKLLQMAGTNQLDDNSLLEAGGMGYWPQTVANLANINLTNIIPKAKNILIVPRDEQMSDTKLCDAWQAKSLNVEQKTYLGSSNILIDAHLTTIPHQSIQKMVQWAKKACDTYVTPNVTKASSQQFLSTANILHTSGCNQKQNPEYSKVQESIFYFGENNQFFGILTESEKSKNCQQPTVIIPNSGANHRVGPSRLYVILARELSLLGFRCLRIDVPGIGDSIISNLETENVEYINSASNVISTAIQTLESNYKNNKFISMGLCSGAYFSFHAALDLTEINIIESILINPLTFYWDKGMSVHNSPTKEFSKWNWYKEALTRKDSWKKLLQGKVNYKSLLQAIINRIQIKVLSKFSRITPNSTVKDVDRHRHKLGADLTKITSNNTHIQFILARSDPGYDILMTNAGKVVKQCRKENTIHLNFIENADHTFSKYKPRCEVINEVKQLFMSRYF